MSVFQKQTSCLRQLLNSSDVNSKVLAVSLGVLQL